MHQSALIYEFMSMPLTVSAAHSWFIEGKPPSLHEISAAPGGSGRVNSASEKSAQCLSRTAFTVFTSRIIRKANERPQADVF